MKITAAVLLLLTACAATPQPAPGKPQANPAPAPPAGEGRDGHYAAAAAPLDARLRMIKRRELQDALDRAKARLREFDDEEAGPQ